MVEPLFLDIDSFEIIMPTAVRIPDCSNVAADTAMDLPEQFALAASRPHSANAVILRGKHARWAEPTSFSATLRVGLNRLTHCRLTAQSTRQTITPVTTWASQSPLTWRGGRGYCSQGCS